MHKISDYLSLWHSSFVVALVCMLFLLTVHANEAVDLNRFSWSPHKLDGCIILNLHWQEGHITLNNLKKTPDLPKRITKRVTTSPFFYKLLAEDGEPMGSEHITIPRHIHFDHFDESTGELKGGNILRDEVDFVIRVPHFEGLKQIQFFKTKKDPEPLRQEYTESEKKMLFERLNECKLIGEISFPLDPLQ